MLFLSVSLLGQLFAHSPWIQTGGRVKNWKIDILFGIFTHLTTKYKWKTCNKLTGKRYAHHIHSTRTQRKRFVYIFFVRIEKYWFLLCSPLCVCVRTLYIEIHIHTHTRALWCCAICECVPVPVRVRVVVVAVVVITATTTTTENGI